MAKQVLIENEHGERIHYTIIESLDDIDTVPCFGDPKNLRRDFNEGKIILVNQRGGYCFFHKDFRLQHDDRANHGCYSQRCYMFFSLQNRKGTLQ